MYSNIELFGWFFFWVGEGGLRLLITPLGTQREIHQLDNLEFSQICQNGKHLEEEVKELKVSKTVKRIACHSLVV